MVQGIRVAAGSELPWVPPGCRERRVSALLLALCDGRLGRRAQLKFISGLLRREGESKWAPLLPPVPKQPVGFPRRPSSLRLFGHSFAACVFANRATLLQNLVASLLFLCTARALCEMQPSASPCCPD